MANQQPPRRLRIVQIIVTPVVMWDDGEELTPGPQLQPVNVPLSGLAVLADELPAHLAEIETQIDAQDSRAESSL